MYHSACKPLLYQTSSRWPANRTGERTSLEGLGLKKRSASASESRLRLIKKQPLAERPNIRERRLGRLAVRNVLDARHQQRLDRAVALLLGNLDLPHRAEVIVLALNNLVGLVV